MKAETDPITDDEWLLRRVRHDQFRTDDLPVISPNAFQLRLKGREPDTRGISLHRESCLANPEDVLATISEDKRPGTGIVRIPVSLLRSLGISAVIELDDRVLGHVVIPQLNSADYALDKARFTPIKLRLATVASQPGNIVKAPVSVG